MKKMSEEERKKVLREIRSALTSLKYDFQAVCMECERLYEDEGLGVKSPWRI